MHYPKVLERVDFPEQIFHRSFSLGAPENCRSTVTIWRILEPSTEGQVCLRFTQCENSEQVAEYIKLRVTLPFLWNWQRGIAVNLDRTMVQGRGRRFQLIKSALVTVGIAGSQMQSAHGAMATTRSGLADLRVQGAISVSRSGTSPLRVRVALPEGKTREEFRIWQSMIRPLIKMEFRVQTMS